MIEFATSTQPPEATPRYRVLSYGLGLLATVMAVAQMVSFEEFVDGLRDYGLTGERGTVALAIALISLEVFSVPFLFRLWLSPLARLLSAICVVLSPIAWTALVLAGLTGGAHVSNTGYLGGFLTMQLSGLMLALAVAWVVVVGAAFDRMGGRKALRLKKS